MGLNQFKGLKSPFSPSQISFGELWKSQRFPPRLLIALNTTLKSLLVKPRIGFLLFLSPNNNVLQPQALSS